MRAATSPNEFTAVDLRATLRRGTIFVGSGYAPAIYESTPAVECACERCPASGLLNRGAPLWYLGAMTELPALPTVATRIPR